LLQRNEPNYVLKCNRESFIRFQILKKQFCYKYYKLNVKSYKNDICDRIISNYSTIYDILLLQSSGHMTKYIRIDIYKHAYNYKLNNISILSPNHVIKHDQIVGGRKIINQHEDNDKDKPY